MFFRGRTTERERGITLPRPLSKTVLYDKVCLWIVLLVRNNICQKKKSGSFSPKIGKLFCQNPFQAILRLKKKMAWTTNSFGGGGKPLVVRKLKTTFFMCVFPKVVCWVLWRLHKKTIFYCIFFSFNSSSKKVFFA